MSVTTVPMPTRLCLWGKAAGRCQYDGCNQPLWLDPLTKFEFNSAYIAHIVADSADGPRGHVTLSPKLAKELSNLMLLCDQHHRLVDKHAVAEHPVERLAKMKKKHEDRIEVLSSLTEEKESHILLYGANVGVQSSPLSVPKVLPAMLPTWYPGDSRPIEIGFKNSALTDKSSEFWQAERANLEVQFSQQVTSRLAGGSIRHLSIFAIAPQPLLVLLGALLSDIQAAEVYQLHREPPDWKWQEGSDLPAITVEEPYDFSGPPALACSLSGTISDDRVRLKLPNASIWKVSIQEPSNDFLKARQQVGEFRQLMRSLFDRIKIVHGHSATIHVFPAMPVALAVELGRIRMPKADLPMIMYDENRERGGFIQAFTIGSA